jgi:hypothetical protein
MMTDRVFVRRPPDPARGNILAGVVIGGFGALLLSFALVPLRVHLPNANMALALVVPVLIGAIVGGFWAAAFSLGAAVPPPMRRARSSSGCIASARSPRKARMSTMSSPPCAPR